MFERLRDLMCSLYIGKVTKLSGKRLNKYSGRPFVSLPKIRYEFLVKLDS